MTPQLNQKATFYPHSHADELKDTREAFVTHVWNRAQVNLAFFDERGEPSGAVNWVAVYDPTSTETRPVGCYYCILRPLEEQAQPAPAAEPQPTPPITGYRQLAADELALINEIKAQGAVLNDLLEKVYQHLTAQGNAGGVDVNNRHLRTQPFRWMAMARTDMQLGLMQLVRAVAQPEGM